MFDIALTAFATFFVTVSPLKAASSSPRSPPR